MPLTRLALVVSLLVVVACNKKATTEPSADAAIAPKTVDAGSAAPESMFHLAVDGPRPLHVKRIPAGPLLAVDAKTRAVFELPPSGEVRPLEPLASKIDETAFEFLETGRVVGQGRRVFVELFVVAPRAGTLVRGYETNLEDHTAKLARSATFVGSVFSWKNESVLAFEADGISASGSERWPPKRGRFVVVSGRPEAALPRLPEDAAPWSAELVGYPSGRIFVLAGKRGKTPGDTSYATIWEIGGSEPITYSMPGDVRGIVQGREEKETLAYGDDWAARFDGSAWNAIAGAPAKITAASIGDDGSAWIVADHTLWRAEAVGQRFERVALPNDAHADEVAARSASDVWVASGHLLFHSQPGGPPQRLETHFAGLRERDPLPFTNDCVVPFFVLGTEDELGAAEAKTLAQSAASDLGGTPVLARFPSAKVYGIEAPAIEQADRSDAKILPTVLARLQAKRPKAKLVCGRPRVERNLTKEN